MFQNITPYGPFLCNIKKTHVSPLLFTTFFMQEPPPLSWMYYSNTWECNHCLQFISLIVASFFVHYVFLYFQASLLVYQELIIRQEKLHTSPKIFKSSLGMSETSWQHNSFDESWDVLFLAKLHNWTANISSCIAPIQILN